MMGLTASSKNMVMLMLKFIDVVKEEGSSLYRDLQYLWIKKKCKRMMFYSNHEGNII
jgi:hypothetical protein